MLNENLRNNLVNTWEYINHNSKYGVNEQIYDQWFRKFKNAVAFGKLNIYRELMEIKDPSWDYKERFLRHTKGDNVLHVCALNNRRYLLEYLLENGWKQEINTPNNNGMTPFFLMVENKITTNSSIKDFIPLFLKYGSNIFLKNKQKMNVLEFTTKFFPESIVHAELVDLFRKKERENSLNNFLFVNEYSSYKLKSKIKKLSKHYKMEITKFF